MKAKYLFAAAWFAICFSALVCGGGEPPPQAPPIDERVDRLEYRISQIELKLGITSVNCPCPEGGPCVCLAGQCTCPNCPEHLKAATVNGFRSGQPTGKGIELLFCGASWCVACPPAADRMGSLKSQVYYTDIDESNPYNVQSIPTVLKLVDGQCVIRRNGEYITESGVGDWLNPPKAEPRQVAKTQAYASQPTSGAGMHSHTCRSCGTTWWHGAEANGDPYAHKCPNCGQYENVISSGGGQRTFAPTVMIRSGYSGCVNGNCYR
jgi:hypothetical protein